MIPMDRKRPVDTHIGQRLKEYRQLRGMTVRELADAAHVTPGQISHYEHGRDRISHERVTEFARILRINSNDLYRPPGSRLRRNHVRWRLTNFMAAVIAEAAALMSSRRKAAAAAADNFEATMVAAVAVAVGASAAAASDAGAGEKSSLTTSADDTAVDTSGSLSGAALKFNPIWHRMAETVTDAYSVDVASSTPGAADFFVEGKLEISGAVSETIFRADAETTLQLDASDAANALLIMDGANTDTINLPGRYTINAAESQGRGGKVAYDPPMSAAGEQASAQSTSAKNGFIVSNSFPFTETASGNKDHSAFQFKPSMDHHAVTDPEINDIAKEQPEHPAQPHSDNFKLADDDGSADPGHATGKDKDISVQPSADPKIGDIAKEQPEHPAQPHSDNFKFADDDGSAHPGHATGKDASVQSTPADNGHHAIADPEVSLASIAPNHLPGHPAENSLHMPAQLDGNGVLTVTDGAHPADLPVDVNQLPSCAVPECRGISHADATFREALWDRFFTAAPRPRTPSELLYSDRRLRSKSSPAATILIRKR